MSSSDKSLFTSFALDELSEQAANMEIANAPIRPFFHSFELPCVGPSICFALFLFAYKRYVIKQTLSKYGGVKNI